MHVLLTAAVLFLGAASQALSAEPIRIVIAGETEDALKESFMQAAGALVSGPNEARYIEVTIPSEALHLLKVDGAPGGPALCSLDEGEGGRRIDGVRRISAEGQTAENIRYFLTFDLDSVAAARPWTDLACQFRGSVFALELRGHFVAKDLNIVEGHDVLLTAVAP